MQKKYKMKVLSLGTWPTEGPGFQLAVDAWRAFTAGLERLTQQDVPANDDRVTQLVAAAQQAANQATVHLIQVHCQHRALAARHYGPLPALPRPTLSLFSAYPQPILSLPTHGPLPALPRPTLSLPSAYPLPTLPSPPPPGRMGLPVS
jgi:hypothetical protein